MLPGRCTWHPLVGLLVIAEVPGAEGTGQTSFSLKQADYLFIHSFNRFFFLSSYYLGHYTLGTGDLVPVFLAFRPNMPHRSPLFY